MINRGLSLSAAIFIWFFITGNLFGDGQTGETLLRDWFSRDGKSGRYESIEGQLYSLFRNSDNTSVPPEILMEKLREGAAKGVPAGRVLTALRDERDRLNTAGEIIDGSGYSVQENTSDVRNAYKIIAIMLREEISKNTILELLREAKTRDLPLSSGASACSAVFQAASVTDLRNTDLVRLGISLYTSGLDPSHYGAVASIFVKGRVNRLDEKEILGIVESVFSRGGGLIRLERELNTRTRR